jgi:hypothetical protein
MELHYNPRVENLCGLIDAAFDGVVLGDGIGLWEAQALDDYGLGIKITEIQDVTPVPHNGCRPPKRRRI